jgi:hypothetical protein
MALSPEDVAGHHGKATPPRRPRAGAARDLVTALSMRLPLCCLFAFMLKFSVLYRPVVTQWTTGCILPEIHIPRQEASIKTVSRPDRNSGTASSISIVRANNHSPLRHVPLNRAKHASPGRLRNASSPRKTARPL